MNKEERDRLSHHEQLRYDYLLANLSYLNAKETEEFDMLTQKAQQSDQDSLAEEAFTDAVFPRAVEAAESLGDTPRTVTDRSRRSNRRKKGRARLSFPKRETGKKPLLFRQRERTRSPKERRSFFSFLFRTIKWILLLSVAVAIGMVAFFFKGMHEVTSDPVTYPPTVREIFHGQSSSQGTNILILGSDQRVTQGSTEARTDTIMVMHLAHTGQITLVSFMRDTLVNIEGLSADLYSPDNKINTAFTIGEQNDHQGAELMRQTLKRNFDIDIDYYALIDFQTFAVAIDTLFPGGVTMDAQFATVNGQEATTVEVPDDLGFAQGGSQYQTLTEGRQQMDGKTLLNYARFRGDDEADFGRTKRQQEVLAAIMTQVKNPLKLFSAAEAMGKVYALMATDVPLERVLSQAWSMMTGKTQIERVTIPDLGDWVDAYDIYGGLGLEIDFEFYKERLAELGLR